MLFPGLLLVVSLVVGLATRGPMRLAQSPPCTTAESRQFDFWVGEWSLTGQSQGPGGTRPTRATNRIRTTLGGCVIEEHFRMDAPAEGVPFEGQSVSVWDAAARQWRQTWVDNQGSYIALTGGWRDGQMVLATGPRPLPAGGTALFRMTFHDISADSLVWDWERSSDDGATWVNAWTLHYRRVR